MESCLPCLSEELCFVYVCFCAHVNKYMHVSKQYLITWFSPSFLELSNLPLTILGLYFLEIKKNTQNINYLKGIMILETDIILTI